ncbi:MAG: serine/threonine-protein kinase [Pirellulaceae bacterium]
MVARFHYDEDVLQRFLHGRLVGEEGAVASHLEGCEMCQRKLETVSRADLSWDDLPRLLGTDSVASQTMPEVFRDTDAIDPARLPWLKPSERLGSLGRFGRYEILELLGSGGMGIVMRGIDSALDRQCAVKVLAPELASSAAARKRFSREAKSAAAVVHAHVVPIQTVDELNGLPYLVMPVVEGQSLQQRVERNGPLEVVEVVRIAAQIADGLSAAHAQGLVHRDIKPANVLLENGVERVQITDFGLARAIDDASMTRSGVIAGTPQYMSPEQAHGDAIDHRSDLFSLGSVIYFMLTGRSPFRAETSMGVLNRICNDQPRSLRSIRSDVPQCVERMVMRLLEKSPSDRYASASEVAKILTECLTALQNPEAGKLAALIDTNSAGTHRGSSSATPPNWVRTILIAAGFAFAAIAGTWFYLETNKGTLRIESNSDVDVPIRIRRGDETVEQITVSSAGATTRLKAGNYVIEVDDANSHVEIKGDRFTLRRGDSWIVAIAPVKSTQHGGSESLMNGSPMIPHGGSKRIGNDNRPMGGLGGYASDIGGEMLLPAPSRAGSPRPNLFQWKPNLPPQLEHYPLLGGTGETTSASDPTSTYQLPRDPSTASNKNGDQEDNCATRIDSRLWGLVYPPVPDLVWPNEWPVERYILFLLQDSRFQEVVGIEPEPALTGVYNRTYRQAEEQAQSNPEDFEGWDSILKKLLIHLEENESRSVGQQFISAVRQQIGINGYAKKLGGNLSLLEDLGVPSIQAQLEDLGDDSGNYQDPFIAEATDLFNRLGLQFTPTQGDRSTLTQHRFIELAIKSRNQELKKLEQTQEAKEPRQASTLPTLVEPRYQLRRWLINRQFLTRLTLALTDSQNHRLASYLKRPLSSEPTREEDFVGIATALQSEHRFVTNADPPSYESILARWRSSIQNDQHGLANEPPIIRTHTIADQCLTTDGDNGKPGQKLRVILYRSDLQSKNLEATLPIGTLYTDVILRDGNTTISNNFGTNDEQSWRAGGSGIPMSEAIVTDANAVLANGRPFPTLEQVAGTSVNDSFETPDGLPRWPRFRFSIQPGGTYGFQATPITLDELAAKLPIQKLMDDGGRIGIEAHVDVPLEDVKKVISAFKSTPELREIKLHLFEYGPAVQEKGFPAEDDQVGVDGATSAPGIVDHFNSAMELAQFLARAIGTRDTQKVIGTFDEKLMQWSLSQGLMEYIERLQKQDEAPRPIGSGPRLPMSDWLEDPLLRRIVGPDFDWAWFERFVLQRRVREGVQSAEALADLISTALPNRRSKAYVAVEVTDVLIGRDDAYYQPPYLLFVNGDQATAACKTGGFAWILQRSDEHGWRVNNFWSTDKPKGIEAFVDNWPDGLPRKPSDQGLFVDAASSNAESAGGFVPTDAEWADLPSPFADEGAKALAEPIIQESTIEARRQTN